MSGHCVATIELAAIRVATLTSAGQPSGGASNGYISDNTIKMSIGAELATGTDIESRNGVDAICQALKRPDRVKRLNLALDLCVLDAELLDVMAGFDPFSSGGNTIGARWPAINAEPPLVCLEAWSKAWSDDEQATPPFTTPSAAYLHWVFPRTQWHVGDFDLTATEFVPIPLEGQSFENSRITSNGPYNDWPAGVSGPGGCTRIGNWFFDATLPTAVCGYTTVPASAS